MKTHELISLIKLGQYNEQFYDVYLDKSKIEYQKDRYINALKLFAEYYGDNDVSVYSAPGRSEIGGNHTDHQHGQVLAASVNVDAIAVVEKIDEPCVYVKSHGFDPKSVSLDSLAKIDDEEETTGALIRGVLAKCKENGYKIGGFKAYIVSDVLVGSGLSSSAAFETLIGTIVSGLYNNWEISPIEIAKIGQYAENVYFGKPSGLMDQMACSVGSLVHIDFADVENPIIEKVDLDLESYGYSMCITDTRGSHADLTADYAAIPKEMKQVAHYFDREVLGNIDIDSILKSVRNIRESAGDRAVLRALHYACENERVGLEVDALKNGNFHDFLAQVKKSGDSSYKYLQNVYSSRNIEHQNLSIALAASDIVLGDLGASRVHGGGFAGTIQAFVPNDLVETYKNTMEDVFGKNTCQIMKIRKYGGIKVM
jgi:galactokinase